MSNLLITAGLQQGRRYNLRERTRIGRAPDNEISLADHLVSRYHAEIIRQNLHYNVHDLGSKNGLMVNGLPAVERRLYRGDQLQIGNTTFLFETPREIRPARFSDAVVHMEPEVDSAMIIQATDQPIFAGEPERPLMPLIECSAQLLVCGTDELGEAVTNMLQRLRDYFHATGGTLLLRASNGEGIPLAAFAEGEELRLSTEAASISLNEGRAIVTSALMSENGEIEHLPRRAMLAPLPGRDSILGTICLIRPAGPDFTMEELGWLRMLGRMTAGALHCAMQREQFVISSPSGQEQFVGESAAAKAVREQARRIASTESTVLLTGETGTGKELVARSIHLASARNRFPFVTIDCSAIPAQLLESELFGYEAGAFTGADRLKRGKIEMAEGGTLFLDEIGELQLELQPKLLRFLESLSFYRVGGLKPISADVRLIAATNRKLERAVEEGRFRQDLLFRLNVVELHLSSLRERREDIRLLVDYFAPKLASRVGKPFLGVIDEAWPWLEHYTWPGNVRELRHSLERALILSDDGILRLEHFQLAFPERGVEPITDAIRSGTSDQTPNPANAGFFPMSLAEAEKETIMRALRFAGGNRVRAAEILQIHRNTLAKKIHEYQLLVSEKRGPHH